MDKSIYNLPQDFPVDLLNAAVSLESIGVKELCWKCSDAIKVIEFLAGRNYGILGGDVLKSDDGEFCYTYDNWYLDKYVTKSWSQYVIDSKEKAISYLSTYRSKNGDGYYYAIVYGLQK